MFIQSIKKNAITFLTILLLMPIMISAMKRDRVIANEGDKNKRKKIKLTPPRLSKVPVRFECIKEFKSEHANDINFITFHPIKKNIAASLSSSQNIRIWDFDKRKCIKLIKERSGVIHEVVFHPLRESVLASCSSGGVSVLDTEKLTCLKLHRGCGGAGALFHPSKKNILLVFLGSIVYVWDIEKGRCLHRLKGHSDSVLGVAVSKDNHNLLVSFSLDKTVRLWNVAKGECLRVLEGLPVEAHRILSFARSSVVFGLTNGIVHEWNIISGACLKTAKTFVRSGFLSSVHPTNEYALVFFDTSIFLYGGGRDTVLGILRGFSNRIGALAFHPFRKDLFLVSSRDKKLQVWRIFGQKIGNPFIDNKKKEFEEISNVAFKFNS